MEVKVVKVLLLACGITALLTGLNIIVTGASGVPGAMGLVEPSVDSELRFFTVFWMAYGLTSLWVSLDIRSRFRHVDILAGIFFFGGIARLVSWADVGAPSGILIGATVLELIIPPVILYLSRTNGFKLEIEGA